MNRAYAAADSRPWTCPPAAEHSKSLAFVLWLLCLGGFCGLHRLYLGRYVSGLLYLVTFGLLGLGQLVDLFLLRRMVQEANGQPLPPPAPPAGLLAAPRRNETEALRAELVSLAARQGGQVSVSQGVLATGRSFAQVERCLDEMLKSGYVDIGNDSQSGAVVYLFDQLAR